MARLLISLFKTVNDLYTTLIYISVVEESR